jgi:hypothetical protein
MEKGTLLGSVVKHQPNSALSHALAANASTQSSSASGFVKPSHALPIKNAAGVASVSGMASTIGAVAPTTVSTMGQTVTGNDKSYLPLVQSKGDVTLYTLRLRYVNVFLFFRDDPIRLVTDDSLRALHIGTNMLLHSMTLLCVFVFCPLCVCFLSFCPLSCPTAGTLQAVAGKSPSPTFADSSTSAASSGSASTGLGGATKVE